MQLRGARQGEVGGKPDEGQGVGDAAETT